MLPIIDAIGKSVVSPHMGSVLDNLSISGFIDSINKNGRDIRLSLIMENFSKITNKKFSATTSKKVMANLQTWTTK